MKEVQKVKFTDNLLRCPRCGNVEIEPDHHYCMICGLQIKENAPVGAVTPEQGARETYQLQDKPKKKVCQMEDRKL